MGKTRIQISSKRYKILNNQVIIPPETLPRFNNIRPSRRCAEPHVGVQHQLVEPLGRTDITSSTFFFSAPKLWNDCVTPVQANAPSLDAFKNHFGLRTRGAIESRFKHVVDGTRAPT